MHQLRLTVRLGNMRGIPRVAVVAQKAQVAGQGLGGGLRFYATSERRRWWMVMNRIAADIQLVIGRRKRDEEKGARVVLAIWNV